MERHFKPRDTDILLATMPKAGTTWLKALTYSISNRNVHAPDQTTHPLYTWNPHELVKTLEIFVYIHSENPNLDVIPSPRIFATHLSYQSLTKVFHESPCKIIYICRNPLDQFVSERHFFLENNLNNKDERTLSIDESFNRFCQGISHYGPFWEHALEAWNAHLKNPDRVLFLKYEDLKKDDKHYIRKIAEFIGCPFSAQEEENGSVEKTSKLCSFENLREAKANQEGSINNNMVKKSSYFRKGETGDWTNYLTKEMAQRMKSVMDSKFEGSGLVLDIPFL